MSLQEKIVRIMSAVSDQSVAAELIAALAADHGDAERQRRATEANRERQRRWRERQAPAGQPQPAAPVTLDNVSNVMLRYEAPPPFPSPSSPPIPPLISPPDPPPSISSSLPRRARKAEPSYTAAFLAFWALYPRKVGKGEAWNAWSKTQPDLGAVSKALEWQIRSPAWTRDSGDFIPHPATYLNQRRWEDEPIKPPVPALPRAGPYQDAGRYLETRDTCNFHRANPDKPPLDPVRWCPRCKRLGNPRSRDETTLVQDPNVTREG